jgi:imidazolonepropionase-like amidohydrolase
MGGGDFILIKNAKILTMRAQNYECGCILIENQKIKKISEDIKDSENNDKTVLDVKGSWVLPGLIDAHCHIGI